MIRWSVIHAKRFLIVWSLIVGITREIIAIWVIILRIQSLYRYHMRNIHIIMWLWYEQKHQLVSVFVDRLKSCNTLGQYCYDLFHAHPVPPIALLHFLIAMIDMSISTGTALQQNTNQSAVWNFDDLYTW